MYLTVSPPVITANTLQVLILNKCVTDQVVGHTGYNGKHDININPSVQAAATLILTLYKWAPALSHQMYTILVYL